MIEGAIGWQCICYSFSENIQELVVFSGYPGGQVFGFGIKTQLDLHCSQLFMLFSE
jgi:hypothetical protein